MKAFITGITGFAGSHLAELLLKEGHEVYGLYRWRSPKDHIKDIEHKVHLLEGDLLDVHSLNNIFKDHQFDWVFHLAAQSFVPTSWISPTSTFEVNVVGSNNLFEAIRKSGQTPVIQIACSSEEYGLVKPEETPITEKNELRPLSPYAVSKMAMDYMGYQYHQSYGLKIIRTRGFNHTGPRRGDVFVTSNFAKQVAMIEVGKQKPVLFVGNTDSQRDFTDVRDMVRGYYLAVQECEQGEVYNIASGTTIYIRDMLKMLIDMSKVKIEVKQDPKRMRPSDVEVLLGDYSKFNKATGWKPEIPFTKTMEDLLNYWREKVK
ncbi:GDP-mannose 4,6-dehydratase [candidate division CPR3 bacterium GWF2_35_18]|uniref:NAD-dependent epimerase/dehydratase n=1 Tax=candidate division CPR3 bacterium GW2011_GWF2_35_18 TaxID=1618350 RepID=A0A0G0C2K9_UNCC3|nr:MAG: NAD-dependent epimerase/dehydratase [candidate division CPR3 bacterium GW2011_GWF2_35_18]OGB63534.1 MAG: GDP-mannose 4,6-dehydratase [candidate division CPR3 bacterium GWF2_35_18]OGB64643.1 MAG: GDP-mannose 4,6-dehydratase [candidate division CPR3 bacterium RIFOXYA2_FULL_35_13]OGB76645.1 MAG: GDP-mannose 4,6-dehydratase [candidate division CPR3 bacterium RIFOXYC2_FULL_35_7]OGB78754.1 MAG: GDP-mannose 4,6-dehydratase [candidate division CPR3 bacterium RIFOXYB2_FULL_35_8]